MHTALPYYSSGVPPSSSAIILACTAAYCACSSGVTGRGNSLPRTTPYRFASCAVAPASAKARSFSYASSHGLLIRAPSPCVASRLPLGSTSTPWSAASARSASGRTDPGVASDAELVMVGAVTVVYDPPMYWSAWLPLWCTSFRPYLGVVLLEAPRTGEPLTLAEAGEPPSEGRQLSVQPGPGAW